MADVYLIHGFLGAGKTTVARRLAAEHGAVAIHGDEWYLRVFADGPTRHLDAVKWARVEALIDDHWPRLVAAGCSAVLDLGFWSRRRRDEVRALAASAGAWCTLIWVECDDATALARCLARNGEPNSFLISSRHIRR